MRGDHYSLGSAFGLRAARAYAYLKTVFDFNRNLALDAKSL
jgi:hypothetical protein